MTSTFTNKTPMGLIVLMGSGDVNITLVSPAVMDWVFLPYAPPTATALSSRFSYNEPLPAEVIAQHRIDNPNYNETELLLSRQTFENDRALNAPGRAFESISELIAYVVANNIEIAQEYNGHIY